MTTERKFARFSRSNPSPAKDTDTITQHDIPNGGMCLSAFLVISERGTPGRILLGHLDPAANWDHIGALDAERTQVHAKGWMIPSCHLMLGESPQDAARRVAKEQLGLEDLTFGEPTIVSDSYTPRRFPDLPSHWDLEFIFRVELPRENTPRASAWLELAFVDISATSRRAMARSHEDVLESVGLRFADSP